MMNETEAKKSISTDTDDVKTQLVKKIEETNKRIRFLLASFDDYIREAEEMAKVHEKIGNAFNKMLLESSIKTKTAYLTKNS